MLRSIFSLIQNIIDSDKEFNNKKSNTVIYLVSNPDNTLNMDLEIDGQERQNLKSIKESSENSESFQITTEQGDTVTCKHFTNQKIRPKSKEEEKICEEYKEVVEKIGEHASFSNEEQALENDDSSKIEENGERLTVKDLLAKLPERHVKMMHKDKDQILALMDQIEKMKKGMERLQEIAQHFNCSEKFKQDIEYLVKNVGPSLQESAKEIKNVTSKKL